MSILFFMSKPLLTAIFGAIAGMIAIATSITQWSDQRQSEKQKNEYQDSIKRANQEIIGLQRQAIILQEKSLDSADITISNTRKLAELAEQNAKLQEELKNQVTGGIQSLNFRFSQAPMLNM